MNRRKPAERQYATCIKTDDPDLLTIGKVYEIIPDPSAEKSNFVRVTDNEGEDYLYPASCFVAVSRRGRTQKTP